MNEQHGDLQADTKFLRDAFATEQKVLAELLRSSSRITHMGDRGEVNEQFFIDFLRAYLPNRYTVDKAIVMDRKGSVSHSIDVVIFDRHYTPTLLDNKKHRYVPAEAVYAVFEAKPNIDKDYLEYAGKKVASVRKLFRTSIQIHTADRLLKPKTPLPIVGGILAADVGWTDGLGKSFEDNHKRLTGDRKLDCGFAASGACFDVFAEDEDYTFGPPDNALAFFAFRLLSKLQTIATVPAVDWLAYATTLSKQNGTNDDV